MSARLSKRLVVWPVAIALVFWAGCSDGDAPTGPSVTPDPGVMALYADVSGTTVRTIVVEVTADDISDPLVFNIEINDQGIGASTLTVPAGPNRTFTGRAYNIEDIETHRGVATVDVVPGSNPTLSIMLQPLLGSMPIEIILVSYTVTLAPASMTLLTGERLQLAATIMDAQNNVVSGTVRWATTRPAVATVNSGGLATAVSDGMSDIVATFRGAGGEAEIEVLSTVAAVPITFAPEASPSSAVSLSDDQVSSFLSIGFNFDFYGNTYDQFRISSNGFITFATSSSSGCCSGRPIPLRDFIDNMIAVAWTDLNPAVAGRIAYETRGTAPNRRLVVAYEGLPWFSSGTTPRVTAQVILYETTNYIEIHTTLQAGGHIYTQGVENADANLAAYIPGRVAANFSLADDAVRFITNRP